MNDQKLKPVDYLIIILVTQVLLIGILVSLPKAKDNPPVTIINQHQPQTITITFSQYREQAESFRFNNELREPQLVTPPDTKLLLTYITIGDHNCVLSLIEAEFQDPINFTNLVLTDNGLCYEYLFK